MDNARSRFVHKTSGRSAELMIADALGKWGLPKAFHDGAAEIARQELTPHRIKTDKANCPHRLCEDWLAVNQLPISMQLSIPRLKRKELNSAFWW